MVNVLEDKELMNTLSAFPPTSVPRNKNGKTLLPPTFVPTQHTVVCGRGKACSSALGNRRLKIIVGSYLQQYSEAKNKLEKSAIVSSIVAMVKQAAPEGAFVKFEQGVWWEVEDGVAREKVGCLLRDCLHTQYRSSTKAKLARRRARKAMVDDFGGLNCSNHSVSDHFGMNSSNHSVSDPYGLNGSNHCHNDMYGMNSSNHSHTDLSLNGNSNHSTASMFTEDSFMPDPIIDPLPLVSSSGHGMSMQQQQQPHQNQPTKDMMQPMCSLSNMMVETRSHRTNFLRDVMPMSAHLDILGVGNNSNHGANRSNSGGARNSTQSNVHRALEEACDILSSQHMDAGEELPEDIDNIFDD